MSFEPTIEQRKAIEAIDRNVLVSAGAGSGKTRVLVERFINIIREGQASFNEVLAITFTRKAAREMKERVRHTLDALARDNPSEREKWLKLKEEAERAQISTIHSFCASLLRQHPVEACIDPEFELMEEADANLALTEATIDTLMTLLDAQDEAVDGLIMEFGFAGMVTELCELYNHLRTRGQGPDTLRAKALETMESVRKVHSQLRTSLIEKVEVIIEKNCTLKLARKTKEAIDDLEEAWASIEPILVNFQLETVNGHILSQIASLSGFISGNCAKAVKDDVMEMKSLVEEFLMATYDLISFKYLDGLLRILHDIDVRYRDKKVQLSSLDYEDLEVEALRLLMNHPRILSKCMDRFKFIMVDEFQDVNELQKEIIYRLASDVNEEMAADKLFLVGDAKQSIYRFRGANVELFAQAQQEVMGDGREGYLRLSKNFRSCPEIIEFVNFIFPWLLSSSPAPELEASATLDGTFEIGYEPLQAARNFSKDMPSVEILIADDSDKKSDIMIREREAALLARRISDMVNNGEHLVAQRGDDGIERPRLVRFSDIAILFRATTDMAIYEKSLVDMGIPYYVVGGSGFYDQEEIIDVMNLLKFISNSHDTISLVGTLRSPFFGVSDETLFWLAEDGGILKGLSNFQGNVHISTCERAKLARAVSMYQRFKVFKDRLCPSKLIEMILEETDYCEVLLYRSNGHQGYFNLKKLIDRARKLEEMGPVVLEDFIAFVETQRQVAVVESQAQVESEDDDVVSLLTVHKAKGLEFPVVIVADMGRNPVYERRPFLYDGKLGLGIKGVDLGEGINHSYIYSKIKEKEDAKELAESRRLLYVALTRARDHLIMLGPASKVKPEKEVDEGRTWMEWISSAGNISLPDGDESMVQCGSVTLRVLSSGEDPRRLTHVCHSQEYVSIEDELPSGTLINQLPYHKGLTWHPIAVTVLCTLNECPRRYYLDQVLSLPQGLAEYEEGYGLPLTGAEIGSIMHSVFERADDEGEARVILDDILERVTSSGRVTPADVARLRRDMDTMLQKYFSSRLFHSIGKAKRTWSEWPFHLGLGDYILAGKVDKIVEDARGNMVIIDFKTDSLKGRDVATVAENYRLQLSLYTLAVERIMGCAVTSSIIYLTRPNESYTISLTDKDMRLVEEISIGLMRFLEESSTIADFPKGAREKCVFCPRKRVCESLEMVLERLTNENL